MNTLKKGKIKRQLIKILNKHGFELNAENLYSNPRRKPSTSKREMCSWYGYGIKDNKEVQFYSWDTMTSCIKHGIIIKSEINSFGNELYLKIIANLTSNSASSRPFGHHQQR